MKTARIFETPMHGYCDIWACTNQMTHFLGRPEARGVPRFNLCEDCHEAILKNLNEKQVEIVLDGAINRGLMSEEPTGEPTNEPVYGPQQAPENLSAAQMEAKDDEQEIEEIKRIEEENEDLAYPEEQKPAGTEEQASENPQPADSPEKEGATLPLDDHAPKEELEGHSVEEDQLDVKLKEKLESKKVDELKELAKEEDIPKYYDMKKDELVSALTEKGVNVDGEGSKEK